MKKINCFSTCFDDMKKESLVTVDFSLQYVKREDRE